MNRFDKNPRNFLRKRSMLSGSPAAKRFLQFVRHIGADKNTLSICHKIYVDLPWENRVGAVSSRMCLVSRVLYSPVRRAAIIHLGRSLPNGSSGLPGNAACLSTGTEPGRFLFVSLFGLAPRGVYLAASVTTHAGELLPHRFTHYLRRGWSVLCCTCRHPLFTGARMLSGSLPYGVRTFLSSCEKRPPGTSNCLAY